MLYRGCVKADTFWNILTGLPNVCYKTLMQQVLAVLEYLKKIHLTVYILARIFGRGDEYGDDF